MHFPEALSFKAGEDLARYRVVIPTSTASTVAYPASGGLGPFFVTLTAANSGESVACVPLSSWKGSIILTAAGAIALGAEVGVTGAVGKVDDGGTGVVVAIALEATTTDGEEFHALPFVAAGGGLLHADVANGTTLTNSVVETALATKTIDGSALKPGDVLEVEYVGITPSTNATDTLTLKLYLGTEVICTTAATDVANDDIQRISAKITIRTVGASGTLVACGHHANDADGTAFTPFRKASATEDISGDVDLKVTGTWSVASASNQTNSEQFIIKHLRAA